MPEGLGFTTSIQHTACGLRPTADSVRKGLILDLAHPTSSARVPPRILIAEQHGSTVESLIQTCGDRQLDLEIDVCTSHRSAVCKLLAFPYQLIISSVHLAALEDFFLLRHTHALDMGVPVVITAATGEKAVARRVLDQGAFDLISIPLEYEPAISTIRLALWHNKLNVLIASRNKALERQRLHIAHYPHIGGGEAFWTIRAIRTSIEQSFAAHNRTLYLIETTLQRFA